jgi:hypothetical protein
MPLYANGRAPKRALVTVHGCPATPDMARRVLYTKRVYDASHSDELQINQIYRFIGNASDFAVGYQDWRNGTDRSGQLEFGASQYYVAGVAAAGGPSAATIGESNHGDDEIGAVDWSCVHVADRRAIAREAGLIHNIPSETWHAAGIGVITADLSGFAGLEPVAVAPDDGFDERDLADLLGELEQLRSIKLYALPGGWVWVGPGGRTWVVPDVAYAVLADYLKAASGIPIAVSQEAFDFATTQFLPTLNPDPSNGALDRILALSQAEVLTLIEQMEVV